jgi:hypothetical protein
MDFTDNVDEISIFHPTPAPPLERGGKIILKGND